MTLGILIVGILYILLTIFMIWMFRWDEGEGPLSITVFIVWVVCTIVGGNWLYENIDWTIKLF